MYATAHAQCVLLVCLALQNLTPLNGAPIRHIHPPRGYHGEEAPPAHIPQKSKGASNHECLIPHVVGKVYSHRHFVNLGDTPSTPTRKTDDKSRLGLDVMLTITPVGVSFLQHGVTSMLFSMDVGEVVEIGALKWSLPWSDALLQKFDHFFYYRQTCNGEILEVRHPEEEEKSVVTMKKSMALSFFNVTSPLLLKNTAKNTATLTQPSQPGVTQLSHEPLAHIPAVSSTKPHSSATPTDQSNVERASTQTDDEQAHTAPQIETVQQAAGSMEQSQPSIEQIQPEQNEPEHTCSEQSLESLLVQLDAEKEDQIEHPQNSLGYLLSLLSQAQLISQSNLGVRNTEILASASLM